MIEASPHALAIVGLGNPIAGDDGVGTAVVQRLTEKWAGHSEVLLLTLGGDLFDISNYLDQANHFIFVDAYCGEPPGQITQGLVSSMTHPPSFHQTDITMVMKSLQALELVTPFPTWEVIGIAVLYPAGFSQGLSPATRSAARRLAGILSARIRSLTGSSQRTSPKVRLDIARRTTVS